tara:strand:- start:51 stop:455 length:405 start_codon:yes stop_codon:yes gene_type:complete
MESTKVEPEWVSEKTVNAIHLRQLAEHGVRKASDEWRLVSALGRPRNQFNWKKYDLFRLAAMYAFGIVVNKPYVESNVRTAYVAALTFLKLNGFHVVAAKRDKYEFFRLAVCELKTGETERILADWFRAHAEAV